MFHAVDCFSSEIPAELAIDSSGRSLAVAVGAFVDRAVTVTGASSMQNFSWAVASNAGSAVERFAVEIAINLANRHRYRDLFGLCSVPLHAVYLSPPIRSLAHSFANFAAPSEFQPYRIDPNDAYYSSTNRLSLANRCVVALAVHIDLV